uniref:DUF1985 domain-containing protein n=1 Tax=Lactuca sativa TaxID=4236 RepID=A0A9R1WZ02_LACSA|nr:hypothetical protein LSAT_V11C800418060 [Lactuca sativa]
MATWLYECTSRDCVECASGGCTFSKMKRFYSMFSNMLLCFVQHDYNNFNVKAIVNLKGSGRNIFKDTVFGYSLDVHRLQGDRLLFYKMFLHQIRPDAALSLDGIKRLYFRVGDTKMIYGPKEFCLITGFNFGEYPENIGRKESEKIVTSKKRCLLRERLFPYYTNSSVKIGDLKSFILNQSFLEVDDADAVRVCLIYILCEQFECLEHVFFVYYLWDFTYDDIEDTWNKINKYLSLPERCQTLKYSVSRFTAPIRIWIYEMLPTVRACGFVLRKNRDMPRMKRWSGTKKLKWIDVNKIFSKIQEGQPPRQNMLPSDGEMTSCYYMSFQEYVYGERKSVPSPVRDHFRREDESSSSMSSRGRSHGRGRGSGKHNLEEVLKRLHALEQHVFTNREPREVFVEEVNNEDLWNNISFEEPAAFQTKFDERGWLHATLFFFLILLTYMNICVVQDELMNKIIQLKIILVILKTTRSWRRGMTMHRTNLMMMCLIETFI